MGHYLNDFETPDEYESRTVLSPMRQALRTYDEERARGIMHAAIWSSQMEADRRTLLEKGWEV